MEHKVIKAIETKYKGYKFRSRLEARWAVFFDSLGIEWDYEKEGYDLGELGWYLPDFWLPYHAQPDYPDAGYFVEIKPFGPTQLELDKIMAIAEGTKHTCWLFAGEIGKQYLYIAHREGGIITEGCMTIEVCNLAHVFSRWNVSSNAVHNAIIDARSARFEHANSNP